MGEMDSLFPLVAVQGKTHVKTAAVGFLWPQRTAMSSLHFGAKPTENHTRKIYLDKWHKCEMFATELKKSTCLSYITYIILDSAPKRGIDAVSGFISWLYRPAQEFWLSPQAQVKFSKYNISME